MYGRTYVSAPIVVPIVGALVSSPCSHRLHACALSGGTACSQAVLWTAAALPPRRPQDPDCAQRLKARTLTNLYNQRPTWLDLAHRKLDEAVFTAYGWPPPP